jgi:hypothetical protein
MNAPRPELQADNKPASCETKDLAPVVLFAFNRADHLERVFVALRANPELAQTRLVVYCDGARGPADEAGVQAVRALVQGFSGCARLDVIERTSNHGLSRSIIEGVTEVCERFGRAIILEDDIVPSPHFLAYMNAALDRYADEPRVMSIGGFTLDTPADLPASFFVDVPFCWGWGVWKRSWAHFEPDGAKLHHEIVSRGLAHRFDMDGAYPYTEMLADQVQGRNASWAVRWYASTLLADGLTLYPQYAVTRNIGHDGTGTHGGRQSIRSRYAESPVVVAPIEIAIHAPARAAWVRALRRHQGGFAGTTFYALRNRIARALKSRRSPPRASERRA